MPATNELQDLFLAEQSRALAFAWALLWTVKSLWGAGEFIVTVRYDFLHF